MTIGEPLPPAELLRSLPGKPIVDQPADAWDCYPIYVGISEAATEPDYV
jgi:hypothetical protein